MTLYLIFRNSEILSLFNNTKILSYLTPEFYLFKKKFRGIILTNAPLSIWLIHSTIKFPFCVIKRCSFAGFEYKESFRWSWVKITEGFTGLENFHSGNLKGACFKCWLCFCSFCAWGRFCVKTTEWFIWLENFLETVCVV